MEVMQSVDAYSMMIRGNKKCRCTLLGDDYLFQHLSSCDHLSLPLISELSGTLKSVHGTDSTSS